MSRIHEAAARRSRSEGLREIAQREASALVAIELRRREDEWRGALTSLKHTLAGLASTCDTIVSAASDHTTAAVSEVVEKIMVAAAADARYAAQQIEAQAQADATEAQTLIDRLQREARDAQEQLRAAREQLQEEHNARAQAESAAERFHSVHQQAIAALDLRLRNSEAESHSNGAKVSALEQKLAAAQAERANLIATLETVHRAVHRAVSAFEPRQSAPPPSPGSAAPHQDVGKAAVVTCMVPAPEVVNAEPGAAPSIFDEQTNAVTNAEVSDAASPASLADYASTLFVSAEATYWTDMQLGLAPTEVIERLTSNLRHANDLFAARLGSDPDQESSVFMDQLARLLDTKSGTSFGRHLSIAAYEAERHVLARIGR